MTGDNAAETAADRAGYFRLTLIISISAKTADSIFISINGIAASAQLFGKPVPDDNAIGFNPRSY